MFPGKVHGVVVHITKNVFSLSNNPFESSTGNLTYAVFESTSLYSISASAKAVSQSVHQ